jgi:riboflavin transporter FmnP
VRFQNRRYSPDEKRIILVKHGFIKDGLIAPLGLGAFFSPLTKERKMNSKSKSITKKLVTTAMFSALAYALSYLEFPLFPAAPFLKLDFSAVFIVLVGFLFGPISGVSACAVKELLCFLTKSSTGGVGELANFIITTAFVIVPSVVYRYKKGFKTVVITLVIACILQTGVSLLVNKFINFPFFMGSVPFVPNETSNKMFSMLWIYVLAFNAIKSVAISIVTILLYKKVSYLFKKINLQNV